MIADAYLPTSPGVFSAIAWTLVVVALVGFCVARIRSAAIARLLAWSIVLGTVGALHIGLLWQPGGFRMLALVGGLLFAMKAVVAVEARQEGTSLDLLSYLGFTALWFGMRPRIFAERSAAARNGAGGLVRRGIVRMAMGVVLIGAARAVAQETGSRLAATLLLLPGLSLLLHFGLFNVAAGAWRRWGVDARALFRAPLLAQSLDEFWSRRWNVGYSEMTSLAVFRPLRSTLGSTAATIAAFLFSGLLHELAISVPVRAGYGLPFVYFALHGVAMVAERRLRAGGWLSGMMGRIWTVGWVVLPTPILFHRPFLEGTIWPLIGA